MRQRTFVLRHHDYTFRHHLSDAQREESVQGRRRGRVHHVVDMWGRAPMAIRQATRQGCDDPFSNRIQDGADLAGLLAGLFEPPTTPIPTESPSASRLEVSMSTVARLLAVRPTDLACSTSSHVSCGSVPHIFSHINMTYHVQHLILTSDTPPPTPDDPRAVWLDDEAVEHANVGTGVKKVWAEVFGAWGNLEPSKKGAANGQKAGSKTPKTAKRKVTVTETGGKIVKKVMMPSMPSRKPLETK